MKLSTLNLYEEYQGLFVTEHVPKQDSKRTHEDQLNEGECKNFNRNGMEGVFHMNLGRSCYERSLILLRGEPRIDATVERGPGTMEQCASTTG